MVPASLLRFIAGVLVAVFATPSAAFQVSHITTNTIAGPRQHRDTRQGGTLPWATESTSLHATIRFKNVEQMLEKFHEEPVILFFTASNCLPCQSMKKKMKSVKKLLGNDLKICSVDTETWPEVGLRFDVTRLPCLVLCHEGETKLRIEGVTSAEMVAAQVQACLSPLLR